MVACDARRYGGLLLAAVGLSLALSDDLRLVFSLVCFLVLDRKVGAGTGLGAGCQLISRYLAEWLVVDGRVLVLVGGNVAGVPLLQS
jgi:hypothetical protein